MYATHHALTHFEGGHGLARRRVVGLPCGGREQDAFVNGCNQGP